MAIVMVLDVPGGTIEQYERANEIMGIRGDDDAPDGLLGHVAAKTDDGMLVIDVWSSQDALDTFFHERLGSALREAGVPEAQPRIYPVHNGIRGRG